MRRILLFILITGFLPLPLEAQALKNLRPVIIDTDGAPDDYRAICMLLSERELNVVGVVCSEGAVLPETGYEKVKALLNKMQRTRVPVAYGRRTNAPPPRWREHCEAVSWGDSLHVKVPDEPGALPLIRDLLSGQNDPVTLVCLGALSNVSDLLKESPEYKKDIRKIIWYNEGTEFLEGTNYALDPEAAAFVLSTGIPVDLISGLEKEEMIWTKEMIGQLGKDESLATEAVSFLFATKSMQDPRFPGSYYIWDELLAVYILYPELFDMKPDETSPHLALNTAYQPEGVRERILQVLKGNYYLENNIVFDVFPTDPALFRVDIRPQMEEILQRYGREEWKMVVLTNEIHGHLGIYSVVGAKMGLLARELLNAGPDQLEVLSFAGNHPPLSCMNDGVQVSTGSTLGQGLIRVDDGPETGPRARFSYRGRTVELRLKEEYKLKVEEDISKGILRYGNLSSGYWKMVRQLALQYWADWDRKELFEILEY